MAKSVQKVSPERKRVRFNKEFKLEAVRLLELGQKPGAQLAGKRCAQISCGRSAFQDVGFELPSESRQ